MIIRKIALKKLALVSRLDEQKALDILAGYGKILSSEIEKAFQGLQQEKRQVDEAIKKGALSQDNLPSLRENYDNLEKSMEYLASIADLLVDNDPTKWEDAKRVGVYRKKIGGQPSSQAAGSPAADPASAPAATPSAPPAAPPAAPSASQPTDPAEKDRYLDVIKTDNDENIERKYPVLYKAISDTFTAAMAGINQPILMSEMEAIVKNARKAQSEGRLDQDYVSSHVEDFAKMLKLVAMYRNDGRALSRPYDKNFKPLRQDQALVDSMASRTKQFKLISNPLGEIERLINESHTLTRIIPEKNGYPKDGDPVIAASMARIRRIAMADPSSAVSSGGAPQSIGDVHSRFLVHVKKIAKHIAGIYSGLSTYLDRADVTGNEALHSMLLTVVKTIRWSATLVANMLNEQSEAANFWTEVKKNGVRMMKNEDIKQKLHAGELESEDILKAALIEEEEKKQADDAARGKEAPVEKKDENVPLPLVDDSQSVSPAKEDAAKPAGEVATEQSEGVDGGFELNSDQKVGWFRKDIKEAVNEMLQAAKSQEIGGYTDENLPKLKAYWLNNPDKFKEMEHVDLFPAQAANGAKEALSSLTPAQPSAPASTTPPSTTPAQPTPAPASSGDKLRERFANVIDKLNEKEIDGFSENRGDFAEYLMNHPEYIGRIEKSMGNDSELIPLVKSLIEKASASESAENPPKEEE
jgi:hypothetical protein